VVFIFFGLRLGDRLVLLAIRVGWWYGELLGLGIRGGRSTTSFGMVFR